MLNEMIKCSPLTVISDRLHQGSSSMLGTIYVFITVTVPGAPHTVLMAVDWEDSSSSSSRWAVGRIWRHKTEWMPNLHHFDIVLAFCSIVWFKKRTTGSGHRCYLLRQLTDEVLGELLELVPLQPGQRLRDWSSQAHCWCLHTHTDKVHWVPTSKQLSEYGGQHTWQQVYYRVVLLAEQPLYIHHHILIILVRFSGEIGVYLIQSHVQICALQNKRQASYSFKQNKILRDNKTHWSKKNVISKVKLTTGKQVICVIM